MGSKRGGMAGCHHKDSVVCERMQEQDTMEVELCERTVCPQCRAVMEDGKWQWPKSHPADACHELCPACRRIRDDTPVGWLTMSGDYFFSNRDEILQLVHATVEEQMARHPLKRLMDVEDRGYGVVISFTDQQLPRRVQEALEYVYDGTSDSFHIEETDVMRVYWRR